MRHVRRKIQRFETSTTASQERTQSTLQYLELPLLLSVALGIPSHHWIGSM